MGHGGKRPGAGAKPSETSLHSARTSKERALAERRWIDVAKKRGDMVDRKAVERAVFDLVRSEREAWLDFPAEVAATVAADLGVEAAYVEVALERAVREQLRRMTAV